MEAFDKKQWTQNLTQIFPDLSTPQLAQLEGLEPLYQYWNAKINVISRNDMDAFFVRHVWHSLGIAKVQQFVSGTRILDVGTGGGFPGIPLAILFPEVQFILLDSVQKKIKVVEAIAKEMGLKNVVTVRTRIELFNEQADFVVSRAVTQMERFVPWVKKNIAKVHRHERKNGILYLKGGDLEHELAGFPKAVTHALYPTFNHSFFETKKVVYVPFW